MSKDIFGFDAGFLKQIKTLMRDTHIQEIEIEDGEKRYIKVTKKKEGPAAYVPQQPQYAAPAPASPHPAAHQARPAAAAEEKKANAYDDETRYHKIKSPVIGTFYPAPSPTSPPFVKVGDNVSKDTTVCIVEAMKVMNEIKADAQGRIVEILKLNGNSVQANEPMFIIEKA